MYAVIMIFKLCSFFIDLFKIGFCNYWLKQVQRDDGKAKCFMYV